MNKPFLLVVSGCLLFGIGGVAQASGCAVGVPLSDPTLCSKDKNLLGGTSGNPILKVYGTIVTGAGKQNQVWMVNANGDPNVDCYGLTGVFLCEAKAGGSGMLAVDCDAGLAHKYGGGGGMYTITGKAPQLTCASTSDPDADPFVIK